MDRLPSAAIRCRRARGWRTRQRSGNRLAPRLGLFAAVGIACGLLAGFSESARADGADARKDTIAALRDYVQRVAAERSAPISAENTDQTSRRGEFSGDAYATLRAFVEQIDGSPPQSSKQGLKLADADNAFDALREFLQKQNSPTPPEQPNMQAPPAARPAAPVAEEPAVAAVLVGTNVCLGCHAVQAEAFSYTLMGRLQKQGKLQCETCHGPGSAHVRAIGCAVCHGDGGITTRPGIPSLVGQDPQYLVVAMKDYITGQRKNALMKALLSGLHETELNNIAFYYARQSPARAQTPLVGNPSTGKAAIAVCATCHGEEGISVSPAFPNLAGQDALYLADAIKAYRNGSRNKVVACAGCHGERGISKQTGTPSLVGLDPQYLVAAMKAYAAGQRKNAVMKALLSGVSDTELNNMAVYYAQQTPARAATPSVGDASAGKTASAGCAGCHGAHGISANPAWPSLAGQDAQYLADALVAYKNGSRTDATMQGIAAALDLQAINNLAGYYASLAPEQPTSAKSTPAKPAPVVVANRLLASLDSRTIDNIAGYYASLNPVQPASERHAPARPVPAFVRERAPTGGRSVGGIISFRPNDPGRTAEENNAICLTCHARGGRAYWPGSVHEERGLACSNCHTIMVAVSAQNQLRTAFEPETCFQCHKDRRAQMFRASHMPMREGKVKCSDCHNPHGSTTEGLIREASINDNCYKCHAEKRGPFLFEHAPVRENCLNCHDPHGSINEFSLKMSRPRLCYECHTIGHSQAGPGARNSALLLGRSCQNCHTLIHGSNSPNGAVFQR